jgi:hypothetical protein
MKDKDKYKVVNSNSKKDDGLDYCLHLSRPTTLYYYG